MRPPIRPARVLRAGWKHRFQPASGLGGDASDRSADRPARAALLLALGLVLAASSAGARIIPPEEPRAESGGEKVAATDRAAGLGCARVVPFDLAFALAGPFALGACLGLQGGEMQARITAADRLWREAAQAEWRAPRLVAARRAVIEARRRARNRKEH